MIIAFSGFKQSGKDSCVNYIKDKYDFTRISFADPLKDKVAEEFNISRAWLDDLKFKEVPLPQYPAPATDGFTSMVSNFMVREFRTLSGNNPDVKHLKDVDGKLMTFTNFWEDLYHTPRSLAILMGSSMRAGDPQFWAKKAVKKIKETTKFVSENVAISDLRYKSEVQALRKAFGSELITIRINRFDSSPSTDPSENDLNDHVFDFMMSNKGTMEELFGKVDEIINTLA